MNFLTSTTLARDKQCVPWMSCRGEKTRLNSPDAGQRSLGQAWFIPPQLRETLVSSPDALDVGKTSVGMFGKAAAPENKINEDKAATASGRAKETENDVFIGNPQFLQMQCENSTTEGTLPCVNFGQCEKVKLIGGSEAGTRAPATSATPDPIVAIVASVATPGASTLSTQYETAGGRVTTWTGRVVSLDEWRRLTAWIEGGPNERQCCGIINSWK